MLRNIFGECTLIDDFLAEQLARLATHIARKDYRGYDIKPFDVKCVLQASILLSEEIEKDGKSQET